MINLYLKKTLQNTWVVIADNGFCKEIVTGAHTYQRTKDFLFRLKNGISVLPPLFIVDTSTYRFGSYFWNTYFGSWH